LVFPNSLGRVDSHPSVLKYGYDPIQIAARVVKQQANGPSANYGLHALRHAAASLWIEAGFNPKRIQTLMGHASIQQTFDTYGHLFRDTAADQHAATIVQRSLLG
jgi:integrase